MSYPALTLHQAIQQQKSGFYLLENSTYSFISSMDLNRACLELSTVYRHEANESVENLWTSISNELKTFLSYPHVGMDGLDSGWIRLETREFFSFLLIFPPFSLFLLIRPFVHNMCGVYGASLLTFEGKKEFLNAWEQDQIKRLLLIITPCLMASDWSPCNSFQG